MTTVTPRTAPPRALDDAPGVTGMLATPVVLVAFAVVTGGVVEFTVGERLFGVNTAQSAAAATGVLAAVRVWRRRHLRVDLLVLPILGLCLVPFVQGAVDGSSALAMGGLGRFATVAVLLVALPQFAPDPPLGVPDATPRPPLRWDVPMVAMGVAIALMALAKVVPAVSDPALGFYDLKDVVQLPLGNHNYVAAILGAALAVALARPPGRTWWTAAAGVIALGLVVTLSRGGWLAAIVVLLVLAAARRDRTTVRTVAGLGIAGALLLVVVVVAGGGGTDRLAGVFSPASRARLDLWGASWDAFLSRPLLGVGIDRLPIYMTEVRQPYVHAHNLVLESLSTTGLVGALLYLTYWAGAAARAVRLPDLGTRLRVGLPLLALFVHAQIDSLSYFLVFEVVVATLVGIGAAQPGARLVRDVALPRGREPSGA